MNKTEKTALVQTLNGALSSASVIIVVQNKGLTVAQMTDLRGRIRKAGAGFKVTKNTLAKLALAGTPFGDVTGLLVGPTAIAYSSDPVAAAKVLVEFAKLNEKLLLIGGAFGQTRARCAEGRGHALQDAVARRAARDHRRHDFQTPGPP